jgi:hypothetical protein
VHSPRKQWKFQKLFLKYIRLRHWTHAHILSR